MNPFWVAKLDYHSISNFNFPDLKQAYFEEKGEQDANFNRKFTELQVQAKQGQAAHFFPKLRDDDKKIHAPPLLLVFCNLVELLRMRESLILTLSESHTLESCFNEQKKILKCSNLATTNTSNLNVECNSIVASGMVNFVEHGNLLAKIPEMDSGLAIDEVCPTIRANLDFQNTESVQIMALDGGLQNLTTTLHYQLVQKHLLQNAILQNHLILLPHLKASIEIELLTLEGIQMPNGVLDYNEICYRGSTKKIDFEKVKRIKANLSSLQHSACSECVAHVNSHK